MSMFRFKAIRSLTFGRYVDASIDNLDHPFVVVHGANESGKSTLTEFLTWMTGGPVGSATESQRFGEYRQKLKGRLLADLDGVPVDIEGTFELKNRDAPNDDRKGTIGAASVNAPAIAAQLGQLQAADYAFIYRFIGPVLHDTESADSFAGILSQFAIGSAVSDVNPTTVAGDLNRRAGGFATEIRRVTREIKDIEALIKEAQKSPARLAEIEEALESVAQRIRAIDATVEERAREIEMRKTAIRAFETNVKLQTLQSELDSLHEPDASWSEAVKNAADIRRELPVARALVSEIHKVASQAESFADQVGLSVADAATLTLSLSDKGRVQTAGDNLKDAMKQVELAQTDFDLGAQKCREAMEKVSQAAKSLGITSNEVLGLTSIIGTWNDLNNAAVTWGNAEGQAVQQLVAADKADEAAAAARALVENDEKFATPARTVPSGNIPVVIAAVAIAGMIAGAVWKPAFILGALLVAGVLGRWWFASRNAGGSGSPVETGSDPRLRARDLESLAIEARRKAADARIDADTARGVFEGRLAPFGVTMPTVELAQDICTRINGAADAARQLRDEEERQRDRQSSVDGAQAKESEARQGFAHVTASCGITYTGELGDLSVWLDTYAEALGQSRKLAGLRNDLAAHESTIRGLFGPVVSADADLYADRLMHDLEHHVEQSSHHDDVKSRLSIAQGEARAATGNNQAVEQLLGSVSTQAELQAQVDALSSDNANDSKERDDLIEQRKSLDTEKSQIENTEFINKLNLDKSALEEELDELTVDKDVLTIAARTLADVINDFQTKNQGPLVTRANQILDAVVPGYGDLVYSTDESGKPVIERVSDSARLRTSKLSTGSRALAYLALRLAFVEADHAKRGVSLPVLCDDPLVHVDDQRAPEVIKVLAQASASHQVILFTCHDDTRDLAVAAGARVVSL